MGGSPRPPQFFQLWRNLFLQDYRKRDACVQKHNELRKNSRATMNCGRTAEAQRTKVSHGPCLLTAELELHEGDDKFEETVLSPERDSKVSDLCGQFGAHSSSERESRCIEEIAILSALAAG